MAVDKILIIGLGLIGGSLARSVRSTGFAGSVTAYGHRSRSLKMGMELGVIDSYSLDLDEAMVDAGIVVLAAPTLVCGALLPELLPRLSPGVVLTDVASVKGWLLKAAQQANGGATPGQLVLGHPLAGSERNGVAASSAELFVDHQVIVTPEPETNPEALACVRAMWRSTGANIVEMGVAEHDTMLAATSHLPHMLSYTLMNSLAASAAGTDIFRFAAGGFRDFTRIASSDPVMWRDIALCNRDELLQAIDRYCAHLDALRSAVETADGQQLQDLFIRAKSFRDAYARGREPH